MDYFVGFASESDKKFRSLDRKFGSRFTITSDGAGARRGGSTSTGSIGAGNGDAQA